MEKSGGGKKPKQCECGGEIEYVDESMAKLLAHPMRIHILAELNKRVMSPSGFSKEFDEKLGNVSYHFRILQKYDAIEEVETATVRGAVEHFYKATKRVLFEGAAWTDLPQSIRARASGQAVTDFLEAVAAAMSEGTFDSEDERFAVWVQRRLDEQGWEEAVAAHWELLHKMDDIFKDSAVRLSEAEEPEGGMLGTYGIFLFESPPPKPQDDDKDEAG